MIARTVTVDAVFSSNIVSVEASLIGRTIEADAELTTNVTHYHSEYPTYDGETTFTPSAETQIIPTGHTVLLSDITINPIPSNYGRITYSGGIISIT